MIPIVIVRGTYGEFGKLGSYNSRQESKKMKTNTKSTLTAPVQRKTHEGAKAANTSAMLKLRRSVLATMLWEDQFYEDGKEISERIKALIPQVSGDAASDLAVELRTKGKLRHMPLFVTREMARIPSHKKFVASTLESIIQRPDELGEFLSIYWKEKRQPLSAQVKKGLAKAFTKFDEYQLSKYNRDNKIKLRDVLFLCHAKPVDKNQAKLWKRLVNDELKTADTWEVALSASKGEDKKEVWESLLKENKLGSLALLRNLRNMVEQKVQKDLIVNALASMKVDRVLPYRFITAAKYAPHLESDLEAAMFRSIDSKEKVKGRTVLLIDVSGSMTDKISSKSESTRQDAAASLAILAREIFKDVEVFTFSDSVKTVPNRRGFALRDAINQSNGGGTQLGKAIDQINSPTKYDRIIVFTDEQSHDNVKAPQNGTTGYVINVASAKNGVGYGAWNHIDGFSEAVLDYIVEFEKLSI